MLQPPAVPGTDFPDFYCAARLVFNGHGPQLYDTSLQREYQAAYSGRVGTLYIHPPFEAIVYMAVAWLPIRGAYLLWIALNLALLAMAAQRLTRAVIPGWNWNIAAAASLTFVPVLSCLLQGQDSILLLLLAVLAFADLRKGRGFTAGCWFAFGLFKFQLVLPLVLVLILTQARAARPGLAKGFGLCALALMALSAAISGFSVFRTYPQFLIQLPSQPLSGVQVRAMANLRGLASLAFRESHSTWASAILLILSAGALIWTLRIWRLARPAWIAGSPAELDGFDLAFAVTVLGSLLVCFHLNPHDLTLLLLPIALVLAHGPARSRISSFTPSSRIGWVIAFLLAILFLPPLHLFALQEHLYTAVSVPMLLLFLALGSSSWHKQLTRAPLHVNHHQAKN
jgi:Glycosyltransferase family 87